MMRKVAAAAAIAVGAAGLGLAPAAQAMPTEYSVTAIPSASTVATGSYFKISGAYLHDDAGIAGRTVKVQTKVGKKWVALTGAKVKTLKSGKYSVRVQLNLKGTRKLRVATRYLGGGMNIVSPTVKVRVR
ncbi:hypothetical protein GCM10010407_09870 [Rarobacter incanus]